MRVPWMRCALIWTGVLTLNTGCTTVLKQGYYEVRGARGEVQLNMELSARALESYQSVRFKPAHTFLNDRLCPRKTLTRYDEYAVQAERELNLELGGGPPTLVIDTEVFHVRTKDLLKAAHFLARLQMYDGDRVVVDAILNVQSQSFREGNEGDLAQAAFKSVKEFIRTHRGAAAPVEGAEEEEDDD